jgi:hypothetical protein
MVAGPFCRLEAMRWTDGTHRLIGGVHETKPLFRLVVVIVTIAIISFKWDRLSRTPAIGTTDRTPPH